MDDGNPAGLAQALHTHGESTALLPPPWPDRDIRIGLNTSNLVANQCIRLQTCLMLGARLNNIHPELKSI